MQNAGKCLKPKYTRNKCLSQGTITTSSSKQMCFNISVDCKLSNLIGGIHCTKCDQIMYGGETGITLYSRLQNNLSHIRRKTDDEI